MKNAKDTITAAILGIVFGIALGCGFIHAVEARIDRAAIEQALAL